MSRLLFQQFLFGLLSVSLCTGRKHQHVRADTSSATISELQDQVVHSEVLAERDLVWQLPPHGPPRGLLLLFHGCSHSAGDFFMDCTDRSACLGLPEERLIVTASQRKENNWVAVAVSSGNREHRCWNKGDLAPVLEIVRTLQARLYLEAAPVFALGASSGGGFAGMLAAAAIREGRPLQAVCIQVSCTRMLDAKKKLSRSFPQCSQNYSQASDVLQFFLLILSPLSPANLLHRS
jgi:poly(3-hydroxybutyrate) depolymerase